jgi:hypothetical protein
VLAVTTADLASATLTGAALDMRGGWVELVF